MRDRRPSRLAVALAATVLAIGLAVTKASTVEAGEPIVIGAPIPRAGDYGQNGKRGMILAIEEINAAGGVNVAEVKRPFRLEIDQDPGVSEREVLQAVEKLILEKKVDLLAGGPVLSECCVSALNLVAPHKKIHLVSIGRYAPKWEEKLAKNRNNFKYSFRVSGNVGWHVKEALFLLRELENKHGFNKIFMSIDDSLMCRRASEIVEELAIHDGWKVVGKDQHPIGSTDYSSALTECKKSGAQILFVWAYAPETSILLKQWASMEVPALPVGFIGAAEDPGFWKATDGKCAYSIVTISQTGNAPTKATPKAMQFYEAFKKRWNVPPRRDGCVSAYEGMYVLKDAIERVGSLGEDALVKRWRKPTWKRCEGGSASPRTIRLCTGIPLRTGFWGAGCSGKTGIGFRCFQELQPWVRSSCPSG